MLRLQVRQIGDELLVVLPQEAIAERWRDTLEDLATWP